MSLANAIAKEKEALLAQQATIRGQIEKLQADDADVVIQLKAIGAYETTLDGKKAVTNGAEAPRTSRRDVILEAITKANGAARGAILEALGVKGDKGAEQSISNALANMVKANQLARSKEGVYTVP